MAFKSTYEEKKRVFDVNFLLPRIEKSTYKTSTKNLITWSLGKRRKSRKIVDFTSLFVIVRHYGLERTKLKNPSEKKGQTVSIARRSTLFVQGQADLQEFFSCTSGCPFFKRIRGL